DVGIGVSGRGSSAARGAADIVLTDDDLGVLLDTLVEGRGMWAGVRDAVTILVGGNVGEVLFTIIGTALGSGRAPVGTRQLVLVAIVQTPGVSHFFGCTPLGPVAWVGVVGSTAAATGLSVLAPNWLAKTAGMVQPELAEATADA